MDLPLILRRAPRFVVYGAGKVASRRVPALLASGCDVTVIAQQVDDSLQQLAQQGEITVQQRTVNQSSEQFEAAVWYLLALDDRSLNAILAKQIRATEGWVCPEKLTKETKRKR